MNKQPSFTADILAASTSFSIINTSYNIRLTGLSQLQSNFSLLALSLLAVFCIFCIKVYSPRLIYGLNKAQNYAALEVEN